MAIKDVVLGYLSWRPMTGYEIKQIIAGSEMLPWSASDMRIYRALVELHQDGWVTKTVVDQADSTARHVYGVTEAGSDALKAWVMSAPEPPYTKDSFLNQLMWGDCLNAAQMDELLDAYLNEVGGKLFFLRVQADEKPNAPDRTSRETYLWEMIYKNWIAHYELELSWIRQMRQQLAEMETARQRALARQKRG